MIIQHHVNQYERLKNLYTIGPVHRAEVDSFARDLLTDCMIDFYRNCLDLNGEPIEAQVEKYIRELNGDLS